MKKYNRLFALLFVLFSCVGCDQTTKSMAQKHLFTAKPIEYANRLLRLEYAENPGGFLSFGANWSHDTRFWIFTVAVTLLLLGILIFALRINQQTPLLVVIAVALVTGGGISNLIDRILNEGRVVDFMQISLGILRTGVFNVADMAIMAGLGLILLMNLRGGERVEAT